MTSLAVPWPRAERIETARLHLDPLTPEDAEEMAPVLGAPAIYRSLYINGYNAIKKADPGAKVLIGETVPYSINRLAQSPIAFLRAVTCVDGSYHQLSIKHLPAYLDECMFRHSGNNLWAPFKI